MLHDQAFGVVILLSGCSSAFVGPTIRNDTLYIDGGIETFRLDNTNYTNGTDVGNTIGVILLNETWNWWTNITEAKLNKTENPASGLIRGASYQGPPDDSRIWTFGGTSFEGNTSFPGWHTMQSSATPLWSFDTNTKEWSPFSAGPLVEEPNYGLSAEAPDQGLAFYLNGQIDNGTRFTTNDLGNNTLNLPGMVVINLANQTFANISTPGLNESTYPRAGGSMGYVPGLGRSGILVALGGAYRNQSGPGPFKAQTLATYDTVDVFDIASYLETPATNGTWYTQATTGSIPPPRIDSCVVLASAPDNSSHNIYLYGGRDPTSSNMTLYDDIYALSLPSFTWTLIYTGSSPRWGHTCHIVGPGKRQLLTVGGSLNKTTDHCDWEVRGVAIYDLSAALWGTVFIEDAPAYNVTPAIVKVIGGDSIGAATLKAPEKGYGNTALAAVMNATRTTLGPTATATPAINRKKSHTGTIVGAVIGSIAGLAAILVAAYFIYRKRLPKPPSRPPTPMAEAPTTGERLEAVGDDKHPLEAPGVELPWELEAKGEPQELSPTSLAEVHGEDWRDGRAELEAQQRVEMEEQHGVSEADRDGPVVGKAGERAELSGTAVPSGGRLGVPVIKADDMA
ncbi:uncharacterized protein BDZ99DRAFT_495966 [Mytilinidion resinicola]|uniref:Galactose oxidase n=1 Tax=Mytilinidion resinicola TaxID=574789 RepID=A0A6A6YW55_9PEZI|nr:uncharacterized protein BDZ99DRAFT_495966 [Mytilinidion resinicola]KAF2812788.1 hypothetical protein BDZ99DRAFT_495966 [Mytilinidion resinicola]